MIGFDVNDTEHGWLMEAWLHLAMFDNGTEEVAS
jgi:hypothetical protein